jgi:hypothetical protein
MDHDQAEIAQDQCDEHARSELPLGPRKMGNALPTSQGQSEHRAAMNDGAEQLFLFNQRSTNRSRGPRHRRRR